MKPVVDHRFLNEPFVRIFRTVLNLLTSSSFKSLICTLFEKLKSNCHGTSILPHRLQPIDFNTDFSPRCKKIPHYLGELARQMADRFIALYYFHSVFVHGVVKLSLSNKFFSD